MTVYEQIFEIIMVSSGKGVLMNCIILSADVMAAQLCCRFTLSLKYRFCLGHGGWSDLQIQFANLLGQLNVHFNLLIYASETSPN